MGTRWTREGGEEAKGGEEEERQGRTDRQQYRWSVCKALAARGTDFHPQNPQLKQIQTKDKINWAGWCRQL